MLIDPKAVESVVRGVREMLLPHYYAEVAFTSKSGQGYDLVTELDVAVENHLRTELGKLYPDVPFVGEETGGDREAPRKWLCDPIDVSSRLLKGRVCFDPYGKDYDFAPGSLLVSEAGGIVANLGSSDYDYTNLNFIAANPAVYKELTQGPEAIFPASK